MLKIINKNTSIRRLDENMQKTGFFIQSDGLDGMGKGVINDAIVDDLKQKGLRIFDLNEWWKTEHVHPDFSAINSKNKNYISSDSFDVLVTSEPTYAGIGLAIRQEIIAKNGRDYSAHSTAQAYALDRLILYSQVILPMLKLGKIVIQSRGVSTSIVYQPLQKVIDGEISPTIDEIMQIEGNKLALNNAQNLLLIPTIKNVEEVMTRISGREKDDDCQFENLEFQLKIKPMYESAQLKKIFESRGTQVSYVDVGKSIEFTKKQAIQIYWQAMTNKGFKL